MSTTEDKAIMIAALYSLADLGETDPDWLDDREQTWDLIEKCMAADARDALSERARWLDRLDFRGDNAWLTRCRIAVSQLS